MEMPNRSESKKTTDESELDTKCLNEPGSAPMHDAEDDNNKDARIDVADFAAYLDRIKESGPDQKDDGDADVGHADDVGCNGGDCGAVVENANFDGDCVSAETENGHKGSSETERLSETPPANDIQDKHNTYDYGAVGGAACIDGDDDGDDNGGVGYSSGARGDDGVGGDGIAYCGSGDRDGGVGYSGVARGAEGVDGADSYGHGSGCIGGNAIPFDATVDSNGGAGYGDGVAAGGKPTIDDSGDDGSDSYVHIGFVHPTLQQPGCCDKLSSYRCGRCCHRRCYSYDIQNEQQNQRRDDNHRNDRDAGVDGFFLWFICCHNSSGAEGEGCGGNDNGIDWCDWSDRGPSWDCGDGCDWDCGDWDCGDIDCGNIDCGDIDCGDIDFDTD